MIETAVTKQKLFEYQVLLRNSDTNGLLEKVSDALSDLKAAHRQDLIHLFSENPFKEYEDEADQKAAKKFRQHIMAELNCYLVGWADESLKNDGEDFGSYVYRRYASALESAAKKIREFKSSSEKKAEKEKEDQERKEKLEKLKAEKDSKKATAVAEPVKAPETPDKKLEEQNSTIEEAVEKETAETRSEGSCGSDEVDLTGQQETTEKSEEPVHSKNIEDEGFSNSEYEELPF